MHEHPNSVIIIALSTKSATRKATWVDKSKAESLARGRVVLVISFAVPLWPQQHPAGRAKRERGAFIDRHIADVTGSKRNPAPPRWTEPRLSSGVAVYAAMTL